MEIRKARIIGLELIFIAVFFTYAFADTVVAPVPECEAIFKTDKDGQHISASTYTVSGIPGDPALPYRELSIIIPSEANENSVCVYLDKTEKIDVPGSYDIAPAAPYVTYSNGMLIEDWGKNNDYIDKLTKRNLMVYQDTKFIDPNQYYPSGHVQLISVGRLRKWKIARVRYYPYIYNPHYKNIILSQGGDVVVKFNKTRKLAKDFSKEQQDSVLDDMVSRIAYNYKPVKAKENYPLAKSSVGPLGSQPKPGYLIITTNAIKNAKVNPTDTKTVLQDFVEHKSKQFEVSIATEDDWGRGELEHISDQRANKIRRYLQDNCNSIKFVLLIGNPNPYVIYPDYPDIPSDNPYYYATNINYKPLTTDELAYSIPMKLAFYGRIRYGDFPAGLFLPTDYYYAELSGDWDLDRDGLYGEINDFNATGGIDVFAEVLVGRIPYYGSFSDLQSILQKTIDYETGKFSGNWIKNVVLSMAPSDSLTPAYQLGELIKDNVVNPAGFKAIRVYDSGYGLNPRAEFMPVTYENVLSALRPGAGFHFWWSHGEISNAPDVLNKDGCEKLDDRYPSFTFQASCWNGYPESEDNLGYQLLKRGAIVTDSSSRESYYTIRETEFTYSGSNAGRCYQYAKNLIRDHLSCGEAHFQISASVPDHQVPNKVIFNLYGDPSVAYFDSSNRVPGERVLINNGATYSVSKAVLLNLDATDVVRGMSSNGTMQFSNDGQSWSPLEPYKTIKEWVLAGDSGNNTVYAKFCNIYGEYSQEYSDTILVDSNAPVSNTRIIADPDFEWANRPVNITFSVQASLPGYYVTSYSLDNFISLLTYNGAFTISKEGLTEIKYYSRASNGIQEPLQVKKIKVDTVPPKAESISINYGVLQTNSVSVGIKVTATDATSKVKEVYFSNDGGTYKKFAYAGNAVYSWALVPGIGQRTVYAYFVDNAGNRSGVISAKIFLGEPPGCVVINDGASLTQSTFVNLKLIPPEILPNVAAIELRDDEGLIYYETRQPYVFQTQWQFSPHSGQRFVIVKFISSNSKFVECKGSIRLETNEPELASIYIGQNYGLSGFSTQFAADIIGNANIVSYSWDFGDGQTSNDQLGFHTFTNTEERIKYCNVMLTVRDDKGRAQVLRAIVGVEPLHMVKAPVTIDNVSKTAYDSLFTLWLRAIDTGRSSIKQTYYSYSKNGGEFSRFYPTNNMGINFDKNGPGLGSYIVKYYSLDNDGNQESPKQAAFSIILPVGSIKGVARDRYRIYRDYRLIVKKDKDNNFRPIEIMLDHNGRFEIANLSAGKYSFQVQKDCNYFGWRFKWTSGPLWRIINNGDRLEGDLVF